MSSERQELSRLTVNVTPRQERALRDEAARLGTSIPDVVRRLLDRWLDQIISKRA